MTAQLKIRRNVITAVVAFSINIVLTFVGFRLVIQQGGTAALGLWAALTASIYVIRLGDVGMGGAVEKHIAAVDAKEKPQLIRGYLDTALLLNTVLFVGLAAIGWFVLSDRIGWFVPGDATAQAEALKILPLVLIGFVVFNLANVISGGLRGLHMGWLAAYLSVAGALLQMGLIVALVPELGVEGLAWAQLAQNVLIGLTAWIFFNSHLIKNSSIRLSALPVTGSRILLRELFSFSIRAQAVNLVNGILEPVSKLMVGHSAGLNVLGIFEMAYKIVSLPRSAVVSGVLGMTPAMTRLLVSEPNEALRLYRRALKLVALGTGAVLVLVIIGAPLASIVLLGHIDTTLIAFVAIMAAGFWINAVGAPAYAVGFAAGRMGANLVSAILSLACVVTLGKSLQIFMPVFGPVVASATGLAVGGFFILWRNQRLLIKR
ncbi:MAG: oligosaccharide flippase family protein [Hydrogenophaga sp.]|nr:oligosaccharide flippase family protein [Hydrogenophaga sp.]